MDEEIKGNDQLEALKKQCDEYLNGWKRAKADLVNYQREAEKEKMEFARYAASRAIAQILPVVDSLYAASEHAPEIAEVVKKMDGYLLEQGVTPIPCEGKYDPLLHEVIGREKREGFETDSITSVVQRGYKLFDKVLRPAKVMIAE